MGNSFNTRKFLSRKNLGIYITGLQLNPDFIPVLNAIQSTGVTLTNTQIIAGNELVTDLQNYNIWNDIF